MDHPLKPVVFISGNSYLTALIATVVNYALTLGVLWGSVYVAKHALGY